MSFLKEQVSFPSNFASIFSVIKHNSSALFLAHALYTSIKRSPLKYNVLDFLGLRPKFVKCIMVILKRQVISSSNFVTFFFVMTHNSPVNFKLIYFPFWIKGSHQRLNFETFKCSGENLPNSSCHFWKHKSVCLQIFCQYLVPSNITPLYFLSSNIIYFGQR